MKTFIALAKEDGTLMMTPHQDATKRQYVKDNPGRMRITLQTMKVESRKQRGFYHGGVLSLWAYLDGKDYKNADIIARYHEVAKLEFNPTIEIVNGEPKKIGGTTTDGHLQKHIEDCIDYLVDNYGIDPGIVLNTKLYKKFRDTVIGYTDKYDTFIDYMHDLKLLK